MFSSKESHLLWLTTIQKEHLGGASSDYLWATSFNCFFRCICNLLVKWGWSWNVLIKLNIFLRPTYENRSIAWFKIQVPLNVHFALTLFCKSLHTSGQNTHFCNFRVFWNAIILFLIYVFARVNNYFAWILREIAQKLRVQSFASRSFMRRVSSNTCFILREVMSSSEEHVYS